MAFWHSWSCVAMVIQIVLVINGGTDVNAVTTEGDPGLVTRLIRLFSYFTIQSNLLVLASAALIVWSPDGDSPWRRVLRLDALLGIVVTGLVYDTILAPLVHPTGLALWITIAFHYFSPWLTVDRLAAVRPPATIRRPHGGAGPSSGRPLWIAYTFAHGAVSDWYPYPFLDVTEIGYGRALRNTVVVLHRRRRAGARVRVARPAAAGVERAILGKGEERRHQGVIAACPSSRREIRAISAA